MSSNHSGPGPQDGVTWPITIKIDGVVRTKHEAPLAFGVVGSRCCVCFQQAELAMYASEAQMGFRPFCLKCAKLYAWVYPVQTTPADDRVDALSGRKDDAGKPNYELLPWLALEQVQAVLDYGAKKYTAHGWRAVKGRTRYLNAALRHIFAYARGEDNDHESGLPHLAHAACSVMFQLEKDDPDFAATEALRKARIARLGED